MRFCLQKAYLDSDDLTDSFLQFSRNIVGRKIGKDSRLKFFPFMTSGRKFKMLQAARGSWKSSLAVQDYTAWRIGRDWFLNGGESRITICLASEVESLSKKNSRGILRIMRSPKFVYLCDDHKPHLKSQKPWGVYEMTSKFRVDPRISDPTLMSISSSTDRTGFHFKVMILDDLQAERSSATRDLIDSLYEFYRLLHSILDPGGELVLICTRWHEDDIYKRIEQENELISDEDERFDILKIPACDKDFTNLRFPEVLDEKLLRSKLLKQDKIIFSSQYFLDPMPEEARILKNEYIKVVQPFMLKQTLNVYVTGDFAWTEIKKSEFRRGRQKYDYTVILTVAIDEGWNFIILDWFREKCSTSTSIKELFRQWIMNKAKMAILQKYDARGISEAIDQHGYDIGQAIPIEWIAYPPDSGKVARIGAELEPAFRRHKVYLHPTMIEWFLRDEFLDFPKPKYLDTLDALCNVVKYGKPPARTRIREHLNQEQREVRLLARGIDPITGPVSEWDP